MPAANAVAWTLEDTIMHINLTYKMWKQTCGSPITIWKITLRVDLLLWHCEMHIILSTNKLKNRIQK